MSISFALLLSNGFTHSSTGSGAPWPVPTGWADAPGNLSMFTKSDTGVTIIDPWLYEHRLGAYKIAINATQVKGKSWWGDGITGDILWGLPLQFGWQHDSGRLKLQGTGHPTLSLPTGAVSPTSWWACMNWFLSMIPFSGALETGIIEWPTRHREIVFRRPQNATNASRFCSSPSECASIYPKLMSKWTSFFDHLASNPSYSGTSRHASAEISKEEDELLGYLWDAHTASIHVGFVRTCLINCA